MLKFINTQDYLEVEQFEENVDQTISWSCGNHKGFIWKGLVRKIKEGEEYKEIDVYDTLLGLEQEGLVNIKRLTDEDLDFFNEEMQIKKFRQERQNLINNAKVTISTGKTFDANETAIARMASKLLTKSSGDIIPWSTADVGTGVMVDCTYEELKEAHTLAVENMSNLWSIE